MGQRRHHYEQAFEHYLRSRRIPYVSVNEARKALLPDTGRLREPDADDPDGASAPGHGSSLKSFDFVVYADPENLLLDVKGRRIPRSSGRRRRAPIVDDVSGVASTATSRSTPRPEAAPRRGRLESWVTRDDVDSLRRWERLFGEGFAAAFVFVYWCDEQPPDALFQEVFEHRGRWYAVRAVALHEYEAAMKTRSVRWRTLHVPTAAFERISVPFCAVSQGR